MDSQFKQNYSKIRENIQKEASELIHALAAEATEHAEAFWNEHHEQRDAVDGEKSNGTLGVRVKGPGDHGHGEFLSITWFIYTFRGPKKKRKAVPNYLPKGDGFSYKKSALAPYRLFAWENKLFSILEPRFANIRERYDHALKIRKASKSLDRLENKALDMMNGE